MIGANIRAAQVYQSSGESTPQAELPREFHATPIPESPVSSHLDPPADFLSFYPGQPAMVVGRWPRMAGFRRLYAGGHIRMPVQPLGADGIPRPFNSAYQPNLHGPLHVAIFYDVPWYFETSTMPNGIGWPGRGNLGLSFKVPVAEKNTAANGPIATAARMTGPRSARPQSRGLSRLHRNLGRIETEK